MSIQDQINGYLKRREQLEIDLNAYKIRVREVEGRIRAVDAKVVELASELPQEQAAE